jgi:hypothetical protein
MDLFDTEAFHKTPAFSNYPPPQSQAKTESWTAKKPQVVRPRTFQVPHEQEVKKVGCAGPLIGLLSREELSLQTYQVSLDNSANEAYLDYFSRPHTRTEVMTLTDKLTAYEQGRVKAMKRDVDPYSSTHTSAKFSSSDAVLMANLKALYKQLVTENFALSSYDFVTIGDSGGLSEFVVKDFQSSSIGDVRGWGVFPKQQFAQDNVEVLPGSVSFAELEGHIAYISQQTGFPTCMLVVGNLSVPGGGNPSVKEKLAKFQVSLYIYAAVKLLTKGGALVFKCHNTWLPATCELLYYVSRAFSQFSIVKPYCSPSHSFVSSTPDSLRRL